MLLSLPGLFYSSQNYTTSTSLPRVKSLVYSGYQIVGHLLQEVFLDFLPLECLGQEPLLCTPMMTLILVLTILGFNHQFICWSSLEDWVPLGIPKKSCLLWCPQDSTQLLKEDLTVKWVNSYVIRRFHWIFMFGHPNEWSSSSYLAHLFSQLKLYKDTCSSLRTDFGTRLLGFKHSSVKPWKIHLHPHILFPHQ